MNTPRTCHICKKVKDLEEFSKNISKPAGRSYHCKECDYLRTDKHRKRYIQNGKEYYVKKIEQCQRIIKYLDSLQSPTKEEEKG